jgi:diadenosine tetraphosphate (Ap4A) HIT family hydrolase
MTDWRDDRVGSAKRGENPMTLARMASGFAFIGDTQFLPGYCVLTAEPEHDHLTDLDQTGRARFLLDMALIGEAIMEVYAGDGLLRVNYEIQGNTLPILHAHIWPRYAWEPEERRRLPVGCYPLDRWSDPVWAYDDEKHGERRRALAAAIQRRMRGEGS